ncbi:MAG: DUF971 domain-containing protein [Acidobacteria bacterium]|nr:DUF971 domain-containing protein [Acidobacteriota bacterium]
MTKVEPSPVPVEIGRANVKDIRIKWNDEHESIFPARFLRLACPCAMCVQEWTGEKLLNEGEVPENIAPISLNLVGRYALQVLWSDGHSSGIYTFPFLRRICPCADCSRVQLSSKPS